MNSTESRIIPLARQFYKLYNLGRKTEARQVLIEAQGEFERIAVVVEALKQSGWSFAFTTWIQSWHLADSIPGDVGSAQDIIDETPDYEEKRGFRIGRTYRDRDRVRVDGLLFGEVVQATIPNTSQIAVRIEGEDEDRVIARHRIAHLDAPG